MPLERDLLGLVFARLDVARAFIIEVDHVDVLASLNDVDLLA